MLERSDFEEEPVVRRGPRLNILDVLTALVLMLTVVVAAVMGYVGGATVALGASVFASDSFSAAGAGGAGAATSRCAIRRSMSRLAAVGSGVSRVTTSKDGS